MSQPIWVRGPVCGVDNCKSRLYRSSDGMKICQYGHVMDGNIEINDDQDDNFISTRRLNIQLTGVGGDFNSPSLAPSQRKVTRPENKRLYGSEGRKLYLKCLQILLKKQSENMIKILLPESISSDLITIVKIFWLKCLSYCLSTDKDEGEANKNDFDVKYNDPNFQLPTALDIIAIIYLATLKLKFHPIYISDLIENIKSNKIPYVKCLHLIPKRYLDKLPSFYFQLLQPFNLPIKNELYESIQMNGIRICANSEDNFLRIPINYYYPLVFKIFSEVFILPNAAELFSIFNNLFKDLDHKLILWFTSSDKSTNFKLINFPDLQVLALIVFTIKLNFIYDFSSISYTKWLDNLTKYDLSNEYSFSTTSTAELLNWPDSKIDKYCQWIYENLIPKKNKTYNLDDDESAIDEELSTMDKKLFQIFNIDSSNYWTNSKKRRKLDPEQDNDLVSLSMNEILTSMTEKPGSKIKVGDILVIEEELFNKLSAHFGVTKKVLIDCYESIETEIKKKLLL